MFPSGPWKGFWHQDGFGRQAMEQFELHFTPDGTVRGQGTDMVGVFTFRGRYDPAAGTVELTKQYLGQHAVEYVGASDGEGKIIGTWSIAGYWSGPFSLQPVVRGDEPIEEIVR
jgi:hypothetical protein